MRSRLRRVGGLSAPSHVAVPVEGGLVVSRPSARGLFVLPRDAAAIWSALGDAPERPPDDPIAAAAWAAWRDAGLVGPAVVASDDPALPPTPPATLRHALTVRIAGRAIRIRWDEDDLLPALADLLAPCRVAGDGTTTRELSVWRDSAAATLRVTPDDVVRRCRPARARALLLETLLDLAAPGGPWPALLHAAAVARDDRAVVLCGTNGVGKSTLAGELVASGWQLVADDLVPLDGQRFQAQPVPFAMSIKMGATATLAGRLPASALGPRHRLRGQPLRYLDPGPARRVGDVGALPVAALVFPRYLPGTSPRTRPLSVLETLSRLATSRCRLPLGTDTLPAFLAWLERLPRLELEHEGGDAAERALEELLAGR